MERTEKLKIDTIKGLKRTHDCGMLSKKDVNTEAVLMGWVNTRRDLGNLIFIDLRDRGGMTQVVFDPQVSEECHRRAGILRNEWVIAVKGRVTQRLEGQENPNMSTGEIELKVTELRILNITQPPPFQVDGAVDASETLRLKHRYLELRRPQVLRAFEKRHNIAACIREFLNDKGFLEVETPFLTKSTPEGARDYLVPSRISRGQFYALPQSPQLFKQLLMIAGFDRYYQIVRCFRDEDLRADRQPEFTQVDLEMAFVEEEDVMNVFEEMMAVLFDRVLNKKIPLPIKRLSYDEAMDRFGNDRPDMRFAMELVDITEIAGGSGFRVFQKVIEGGGSVKAITVKEGGGHFSRKGLEELSAYVAERGAGGLAWIKVKEKGWQSSLDKFFSDEGKERLNKKMGATNGDLILIVADKKEVTHAVLGALRLHVAEQLGLIEEGVFSFVWITRFPLFEYNEDEERLEAVHHPFTAPAPEDILFLDENPERVKARSYDLVLNGAEIGGGSVRIHDIETQEKIFRLLGISSEEARAKFGFLLEALRHGAPPHGGMALGFDRLVAIMTGVKSIREVIAFPKTTNAGCPLTGAPSVVAPEQLRELGISLVSED